MIIIGICDDEQNMRSSLRTVLERKLQLMGLEYAFREYDSGESLLADKDVAGLELLFLDIEMKGINGMDTARALRRHDSKALIVFVTAYPDFVFQGYEVHAFHYILKPYEETKIYEVLEQALEKVRDECQRFYTVEQKSGVRKIPLDRITAFCSDRRMIKILTANACMGKATANDADIQFYGKLSEIEQELPEYFVRTHNRWLVNLNFVTALENDKCICGNMSLPISRAYKQTLEIAFAKMLLK